MKDLSRTVKAGYLAFGNASTVVVSLAIAALLSRLLTKEDYATYRQTLLTYTFLAPFLGLGLPAAIVYFLTKSPERARKTLTEILVATSLMGLVFSVFILFGGAKLIGGRFNNPQLEVTLKWFAFYPLLVLPSAVVAPTLVAKNRAPLVAGFTIWSSVVRLTAVALPILLIAREPVFAVQGLLVGSIAVLIPAGLLLRRVLPDGSYGFEFPHLQTLLVYAIPLSLGAAIGTLNRSMDKILVSAYSTPETFAVFVNGAMEVPFIGVIAGAASQILLPEITRLYDEKSYKAAIDIFRRSAIKCGAILIPLGGVLFVLAPEMMMILYGPDFKQSATFFRIYLLLLPFRSVVYGVLFLAAGRTDLVMKRAFINLIINVSLSIVLLKWIGPIGAAVGTLLSMLLFVFPYCIVSCARLFRTSPFRLLPYQSLGVMVGVVAMPACISWFWLEQNRIGNPLTVAIWKFSILALFILPLTLVSLRKGWINIPRMKSMAAK